MSSVSRLDLCWFAKGRQPPVMSFEKPLDWKQVSLEDEFKTAAGWCVEWVDGLLITAN